MAYSDDERKTDPNPGHPTKRPLRDIGFWIKDGVTSGAPSSTGRDFVPLVDTLHLG